MTRVWSPVEEKDFSSILCVQTSSEAHPAHPMGARGPTTGVKRSQGMTLTTPPSSANVKNVKISQFCLYLYVNYGHLK
jgi:hypothetical protein